MRVALVASRLDADARAALQLFEQAIAGRCEMECRCVEFDAAEDLSERLADVDCVVLFRQGLHVARHWADIDQGGDDRVFHARLGPSENFRPQDLARLVLDALAWIGW